MIKMNDFTAISAEMQSRLQEKFSDVLSSGWHILGPHVREFEAYWAAANQASHAVGCGNGLDGLEIVMRSLSIGEGDEVITTSMTAFATVLGISRASATPVIADIEVGSGLLSIDSVRAAITPKTKAIILVHLFGQIKDMEAWQNLAREHNLYLIEDCAQSHLSQWNGKTAGSWGKAGVFSFYPTKNLGAIGDAGCIITQDKALAEKSAMLRNYGQVDRYNHAAYGLNSRLDELQAAILLEKGKSLISDTQRRQDIAARYHDEIKNDAITLLDKPSQTSAHVYHLYVVLCENRDKLAKHLEAHNIQSLIHYPIVSQDQPCGIHYIVDKENTPNARFFAKRCLSLPCHPHLSDEEVSTVISVVNSFK